MTSSYVDLFSEAIFGVIHIQIWQYQSKETHFKSYLKIASILGIQVFEKQS